MMRWFSFACCLVLVGINIGQRDWQVAFAWGAATLFALELAYLHGTGGRVR